MPTFCDGDVEWDEQKAAINLEKHKVSFAEAATVLADPSAVYLDDGSRVGRVVIIGMSTPRARLLYVVTVERRDRDRIVSARKAKGEEYDLYAKGEP